MHLQRTVVAFIDLSGIRLSLAATRQYGPKRSDVQSVYVFGPLRIEGPTDKFKNVRPCVPAAHVQTQSAKKNDSGLELKTTQNISPKITQNNFPNHTLRSFITSLPHINSFYGRLLTPIRHDLERGRLEQGKLTRTELTVTEKKRGDLLGSR